jgi:hypothetical protein
MDNEFLIVDRHISKNGNATTEFKECDGKILVKHFSGFDTDNFIVKKFNGKKMEFSFFKLNGVYYVNINGHHIIDYKRFINIQEILKHENAVHIKNSYIGEVVLPECDVDIVHKALVVMADWMKHRSSFSKDMLYYIFH